MERSGSGLCDGRFPEYRKRTDIQSLRETVVFDRRVERVSVTAEQLDFLLRERQRLARNAQQNGKELTEGVVHEDLEKQLILAAGLVGIYEIEGTITETRHTTAQVSSDAMARLFSQLDNLTLQR